MMMMMTLPYDNCLSRACLGTGTHLSDSCTDAVRIVIWLTVDILTSRQLPCQCTELGVQEGTAIQHTHHSPKT